MDLKLCPKCNKLPLVRTKHKHLIYECAISCKEIGCKLYWPIVEIGFTEQKAMDKAAAAWNKAVEQYDESRSIK